MNMQRKPQDIDNRRVSLRTNKDGVLTTLVFFKQPDLRILEDRQQVYRAATRLLQLVEWFDSRDKR